LPSLLNIRRPKTLNTFGGQQLLLRRLVGIAVSLGVRLARPPSLRHIFSHNGAYHIPLSLGVSRQLLIRVPTNADGQVPPLLCPHHSVATIRGGLLHLLDLGGRRHDQHHVSYHRVVVGYACLRIHLTGLDLQSTIGEDVVQYCISPCRLHDATTFAVCICNLQLALARTNVPLLLEHFKAFRTRVCVAVTKHNHRGSLCAPPVQLPFDVVDVHTRVVSGAVINTLLILLTHACIHHVVRRDVRRNNGQCSTACKRKPHRVRVCLVTHVLLVLCTV